MVLVIERVTVGPLDTNSYVVFDSGRREGILIDAGGDPVKILSVIEGCNLRMTGIYLTHGHFDHVLAVNDLKKELNCGFYIHDHDREILLQAPLDAERLLGLSIPRPPPPDGGIKEGDVIYVGGFKLEVIHTPGHTPGSVCFVADECVFTGDTLFAGSIGRTDLAGGDLEKLISSIQNKLFVLPDDCVVYPGHGPSTVLRVEKLMNPFVGKGGLFRK
ncbi:MAG: MBL fold metallo-hydrolase [Nitrososphaeria archaeon]|nr:MBL fold metallo-hydrolase [Aigarchaeota archaeon]MCX8187112.1 MBL fold metallo-hydrolase [Nitrososphaeria archaeon]